MTIDGQNPPSAIFYGHAFRPPTQAPSSTEPPLTTPDAPDTAMVADAPAPDAKDGMKGVWYCSLPAALDATITKLIN